MKWLYILLLLFVVYVIIVGAHARTGCLIPIVNEGHTLRHDALTIPGYWKKQLSDGEPDKPFSIVDKIPDGPPLTSKALVFSLYGTNRVRYFDPLLKTIQNKQWKQDGWHFRVYIHDECKEWIRELMNYSDDMVQLYIMHDEEVVPGKSAGAFWRFLALVDDKIGCVIYDTDEYIPFRQVTKKWNRLMRSDKSISVKHMAPFPKTHIQAQHLYKKRSAPIPCETSFIMNYPRRREYGCDEIFTTREIADFYLSRNVILYRRRKYLLAFLCPDRHCE